MLKVILIIASILLLKAPFGEPVKCYHCFESFNKTLSIGSLDGGLFGDRFVRCDKNKNKWNNVECPVYMPICILMSGTVQNHYEVVRSCAQKNFCSKYVPPSGVKVDYCGECNTTLCNDYQTLPDPPSGPLFTFNININLNMKKQPVDSIIPALNNGDL